MTYSRLAVVLQAFRPERAEDAPRGFGVLVPRGEGLRSLGILYLSSLFPQRVPEGVALTTSFFGGALDPSSPDLTEGDLLKLAEAEVQEAASGDRAARPRPRPEVARRSPTASR